MRAWEGISHAKTPKIVACLRPLKTVVPPPPASRLRPPPPRPGRPHCLLRLNKRVGSRMDGNGLCIFKRTGRPLVCPTALPFRNIKATKHVVHDLPSPCPVVASLVRPYKALAASGAAALTKVVLSQHGIDVSVFGPHSTSGAGIDVHQHLHLPPEVSCEIGSWKNEEAYAKHYCCLKAINRSPRRSMPICSHYTCVPQAPGTR